MRTICINLLCFRMSPARFCAERVMNLKVIFTALVSDVLEIPSGGCEPMPDHHNLTSVYRCCQRITPEES